MAAIEADIAGAVTSTNAAQGLMEAAMQEFHTHCQAHQWVEVEAARLKVVSHMESYLDNMAATYKILARYR